MNRENFERLKQIDTEVQILENQNNAAARKEKRIGDYIKFFKAEQPQIVRPDGKVEPKKQKIIYDIRINPNPTEKYIEDCFNLFDDNNDDFVDFLKKCQKNYKKLISENEKKIGDLQREFGSL